MILGLGFDLLLHFLKRVRPNFVAQLSSPPSSHSSVSKNIQEDLNMLLNSNTDDISEHPELQTRVNVVPVAGYDETLYRYLYQYIMWEKILI